MGTLFPTFLIAAAAVAVPLWLHLFHRTDARRIDFPALRYLQRTERDHARVIRLRQLLLLLLRTAAVLLLVGAGARLYVRAGTAAHPPTAVAIILDNSASSGRVIGTRRILDVLKDRAFETVSAAGPDDRIWVIRAGEPWTPSLPRDCAGAEASIRDSEPRDTRADLHAALARARELLATSGLPVREIHVLSDLQATNLGAAPPPGLQDIPVLVWTPPTPTGANRGVVDVTVGGGLAPLAGQRWEVAVELAAYGSADSGEIPVRVVVDGRIRGAGSAPANASVVLALPPLAEGWVTGWAETDADALRADDRRYFAFRSRTPPRVSTAGAVPAFVEEALGVLEAAHRLTRVGTGPADLVLSFGGTGAAESGGAPVFVVPDPDPLLLPALNRRLAAAGVPWRYEAQTRDGEARVTSRHLPDVLEGLRVARWFRLDPRAPSSTPPRVLARAAGEPWLLETGTTAGRRFLLLASPASPAASDLPVTPGLVRMLDWAASAWAGGGGTAVSLVAGAPLPAPAAADRVRRPDGSETPLDGTRMVQATSAAGLYAFLSGDSVVGWAAVSTPREEADPTPGEPGRLHPAAHVVADAQAWPDVVFVVRRGGEVWRPLLGAALLLLIAESLLAASGREGRRSRREVAAGV